MQERIAQSLTAQLEPCFIIQLTTRFETMWIFDSGFSANFTCHEPIDFPTVSQDNEQCMNWLKIFDMSPIGGDLPHIPLNSDYWNTTFLFDESDMEQTWHPMVQWDDNRCRSIYPGMVKTRIRFNTNLTLYISEYIYK